MPADPRDQPLGFEAMVTGDGTVIVVLSGEFDTGNIRALAHHLAEVLEYQPRRLVFDLAEVGFVDCASARLIAGTGRSLPEGVRPVISRPRLSVRRVLEITGLDTLCDLGAWPPQRPGT
jgi:anti-anti-sigma factor